MSMSSNKGKVTQLRPKPQYFSEFSVISNLTQSVQKSKIVEKKKPQIETAKSSYIPKKKQQTENEKIEIEETMTFEKFQQIVNEEKAHKL